MAEKILIVEDDLELQQTLTDYLTDQGFYCESFTDPVEGFARSQKAEFDLLISDLKLPHMNGIELATKVKDEQPDIRVLIMTAYSSMPTVIEALRLGVDNYLLKPFTTVELLFQVRKAMERRKLILENKRYQQGLAILVEEQTKQLLERHRLFRLGQMENIFAICNIIEARDEYTRGHTERVTLFAISLARELGWDSDHLSELFIGSPLHDIGKVGIPNNILKKDGPLTFTEYEKMKDHPNIGYEMVCRGGLPIATTACILYHHERFDGSGYPFGLKGENIPAEGRLMAICDVFDAVTSNRVYRNAICKGEALDILRSSTGTQFDPEYFQVFDEILNSGELDTIINNPEIAVPFTQLAEQFIGIGR